MKWNETDLRMTVHDSTLQKKLTVMLLKNVVVGKIILYVIVNMHVYVIVCMYIHTITFCNRFVGSLAC
jgi:hypothetical protein